MLDKADGFFRDHDATKYLVIFGLGKYNSIYDTIRYLIGLRNGITYAKIKTDADDLPFGGNIDFS